MFDLGELKIRGIRKEDSRNIINLIEETKEVDNVETGVSEEELNFIADNPEMREGCYVAYLNNKLVAFGACFTNALEKNQAYLRILVHPDFRKKGIGSNIYETINKKARDLKCDKLYAGVDEKHKEVVDFLKKRDFEIYGYLWRMELSMDNKDFGNIDMEGFDYLKVSEEDINQFVKEVNEGFEDKLEHTPENPSTHIYFLQRDSQPAATATIIYHDMMSLGIITNIVLYNEQMDQRIGRILMKLCLSKIQERGLSRAALEISGEDIDTLKFYLKQGFEPVETIIKMQKNM